MVSRGQEGAPGVKQILGCRNEAGLQWGRVCKTGKRRGCLVEKSCRVER